MIIIYANRNCILGSSIMNVCNFLDVVANDTSVSSSLFHSVLQIDYLM